jgi:hypothetical protein
MGWEIVKGIKFVTGNCGTEFYVSHWTRYQGKYPYLTIHYLAEFLLLISVQF